MTNYKQQDVLLVEFRFSEGEGSKKRPALVISTNKYNNNLQEVIMAAITSNTNRVLFGDTKIELWDEAGLLYPSLVTGVMRTIKGKTIIRKLGVLSKQDFQKVQKNLKKIIDL